MGLNILSGKREQRLGSELLQYSTSYVMQEEKGAGTTFVSIPQKAECPCTSALSFMCSVNIANFRMSNRKIQEHLNIQTFACVQIVNSLFKRSFICHYLRLNEIAE